MKRKFKIDILVRNNRIQQMQDQGIVVNYQILNDKQYICELKRKIVEEANEVAVADTIEELSSEIGNVLEVIDHLIDVYKLDIDNIQKLKTDKQKRIGKFDKRYKTNFVEIDEDNEAINYYLKKKDKYPEIVED